jgi:hypothetical protein
MAYRDLLTVLQIRNHAFLAVEEQARLSVSQVLSPWFEKRAVVTEAKSLNGNRRGSTSLK